MSKTGRIIDSALDAIGNTPLIRLDRIAKLKGLKCNLFGKVEFLSSGGSVKDRIAKRMIEAAEKEGKLIPGKSVIVEPTSGNTGIGLAMTGAIKGYPVIITMPEKMSLEKEATLRALGAEVVRTPTEAPWDSPESLIGVAKRLQREIPNAVILDQYSNVNNPLAHQFTTGPEIIQSVVNTPCAPGRPTSGKVDVFIAGAGTGGTITGVSRAIKQTHNPDCIIVGIDPLGSVLAPTDAAQGKEACISYVVEGIGYDFVPDVLSHGDVDTWIKAADEESFDASRVLMLEEGLLVGGSSGSALVGAFKWFESPEGKEIGQTEGLNVVVLLADGLRNYMSKSWFLQRTMQAEPSPLAGIISSILNPSAKPAKGASNGLQNGATNGVSNGHLKKVPSGTSNGVSNGISV